MLLSLPHILALLSQKTAPLFSLLKLLSIYYKDIQALFVAFAEAHNDNALSQLQGQLGSARIGVTKLAKVVNKKHQSPMALVVDELPTIYFRGLTTLIGVGRSNQIAVMIGVQDFSQIRLDYGDKQADVTVDTVSNIFFDS